MAENPAEDLLQNTFGGFWSENPKHPLSDWQYEVASGDTRLGYWEWMVAQIEL